MEAPLYSRFHRRFARDLKFLRKRGSVLRRVLLESKYRARVYSLSDDVSEGAGALSALPPKELCEIVQSLYLPSEYVWVEFNWLAMQNGMTRCGIPARNQV